MYEPCPNKVRNVAHEIRRQAIIVVMAEMGEDNFIAAVDGQVKSGDVIEWDDPDREGATPIVMDEVNYDMRMNYYVKLKLPQDIEAAVWRHIDVIAAQTPGKRTRAKLDEAFNSYQELYNLRTKAHDAALKHGFPSYSQRWLERPIYRLQQALSGLGPFFCVGGRKSGELTDVSMFNRAWMINKLSEDGRQAAEIYLEILNGWTRDSVQGKPIAPIGVMASGFTDENRHMMFKNESGLVPAHLPWIIRDAVAWMKEHPCMSNLVDKVEEDTVDHYGRQLKGGMMNMRFQYLAEGREVGEMTLQDFWFETRYITKTRGFTDTKMVHVMVTTHTAKKREDPYNGTGIAEQP
eukprot:4465317-Amphidinium_carterae.1